MVIHSATCISGGPWNTIERISDMIIKIPVNFLFWFGVTLLALSMLWIGLKQYDVFTWLELIQILLSIFGIFLIGTFRDKDR